MLAIRERHQSIWSTLALVAAVGCGGGGDEAPTDAPAAVDQTDAMSVRISQPVDGAAVDGGSVRVVFEVENVAIAPAGTMEPGTGHHHLLVNTDLTPEGQPIPATEGVHVHFGQGQTEYEMTDLAPGDYTIIAVVADGVHIPLQPWVVDTVQFTVR